MNSRPQQLQKATPGRASSVSQDVQNGQIMLASDHVESVT